MKKAVSLLISVFMCLSVSGIVFADNQIGENMTNAISSAKEKLGIDDEAYVLEDCSENENSNLKTYSIRWKSRGEYDSKSIFVEIDDEGLIWDYHQYNRNTETKPLPACTSEEGKRVAQTFLEAMNPIVAKESALQDITYSKYSGSFAVTYVRMHNGIRVNNQAVVTVHADTQQVVDFASDRNKYASFEEGEPISFDEARDVFKNDIAYDLYYYEKTSPYYEDDASKNEICLIYMLKGRNKYINAFTGTAETYSEILEERGESTSSKNDAAAGAMASDSGNVSLSEEEIARIRQLEDLISREEAEEKAREVSEFRLGSDMTLTNAALNTSYRGEYVFRLTFQNGKTGEEYQYASVIVDAKNGTVISYYAEPWSYEEQTETEKTEKAATDKENAFRFINQYYPDLANTVKNTQNTEYRTYFARVHDGVTFKNNGFSFVYRDGKLVSFEFSWSQADIPSKSAAQSLEKAYGVILDEDKFVLNYIPVYRDNQCEMKLVYRLEDTSNYSAESLLPLNYRMEERELFTVAYTDIAGHYAENAIQKLAEAELVLGEEKETEFRPEEFVKQKDFLTLACKTFDRGTYNLYQNLVSSGIIEKDEIAPDKELTRMEAIRYIVKLAALGELAEQNEIFQDVYTDVNEADRGYAAIAAGCRIVNSEVTELYPNNGLRRADAVMMMYNWLTK